MIEAILCACTIIIVSVVAFCSGFLFCLRAWHLHKIDKIDPANIIKTPKAISAGIAIKREERIQDIMNRG